MTSISPSAEAARENARRTSGLFGAQLHSAPESPLHMGMAGYIDETFPVPQANRLESVSATVAAVGAEVNTATAVAEALDVDRRQGSYYLNAAGYLGLVEADHDYESNSAIWSLTGLGHEFVALDVDERCALLAELAESTPAVAGFRANGIEGARATITDRTELGEDTVIRRAAAARSWAHAIDSSSFVLDTATLDDEARQRFAAAAEIAKAERVSILVARAEREPQFCPNCFLQLPVTGICPNC